MPKGSRLGLRIYVASGSDASCEQQLTPEWLPISAVKCADQNVYQPAKANPLEVVLPPPEGMFEVVLAEPISADMLGFVRLDAVRRRVVQPKSG